MTDRPVIVGVIQHARPWHEGITGTLWGIGTLAKRWKKCIESNGNYFD
ncbi:hypothetical protein WH47_05191 [Habropoda laboriosa]|uniref:Uncharacterized protein n=1 Tax=Habropoda laboriosa TaxID=597456 RepID=A0A0L7QU63_9HYME|nr:hypothetical protein WH47_05191 [Habropoda laboriosa]